jgi:hypothetical protein
MTAAVDTFDAYATGLDSSANRAFAITPHNENQLAFVTRGLYVGGAGNVRVITAGGDTVTFASVPAGTILPVRVRVVLSTSTTATNILGLY